MRIPSGKVDQAIFFVAVDSVDRLTRKTGLTTFTVYRSRNGGAATVYTTPTVTELSAANMPGVYSLLIDEDTTIASGSDSEEYAVHITQASMAPVTRTVELYRRDTTSGATNVAQTGDSFARLGVPAGASVSADVAAVKVDTAAIKTKTDSLTFTVAGQVDSNVIDWKGSAAPAMTGDAYARLGAPAGASVSADVAAVKADSAAVKLKTDNLPSDPADASDIAASFSTVNASLAVIAGYIDTEVATLITTTAAIKLQTDKLIFTVSNVLDVNIQYVNDVQVTGNGETGTEWGPV